MLNFINKTTSGRRTLEDRRFRAQESKKCEMPAEGERGPKRTVRLMRHEDIDKCLQIWSKVGLSEGRQTVASVLSADPNGFYVAELEHSGEVVGMCAATMTRADTAFVGFYAVEPAHQRIGIGRELWSKTLERLGPEINLGLYGVPSMSEKYKASGFIMEDSIRMLIFDSLPGGVDRAGIDSLKDVDQLVGQCRLELIDGQTSESLLRKLIEYDSSVQQFSRESLLRLYLAGDDVPLTVAVVRDHGKGKSFAHHASQTLGERKSSCCAKPSQESIREDDEALSTRAQLIDSTDALGPMSCATDSRMNESPTLTSTTNSSPNLDSRADPNETCEVLGYGCVRHDNNSGGMVGPIYADSGDLCEVILRNLLTRFELGPKSIYSVMALSSNEHAGKILTKIGLKEVEQCTRMFTKFVPAASMSKIYFVHSPNFTLF